jgi:hypothetical protein
MTTAIIYIVQMKNAYIILIEKPEGNTSPGSLRSICGRILKLILKIGYEYVNRIYLA